MKMHKTQLILLFALALTILSLSAGCADIDQQTYTASATQAEAQRLAAPEEAKARGAEAAGDKREALQHYIAALQSLPADDASEKGFQLRRSIISLALSMSPPPSIPEEAQRHFDQAALILKDSKNELACARAAQEFEASLRLAPWNADAYYNLGSLKKLANDKDSAVRNFKLYLLAAPGAADARNVQNEVAALELQKRKTGLGALEGIWRTHLNRDKPSDSTYDYHYLFEVQGREIVVTSVLDKDNPRGNQLKGDSAVVARFRLDGRRIVGRWFFQREFHPIVPLTGIVSEGSNEIYWRYPLGVTGADGEELDFYGTIRRHDE